MILALALLQAATQPAAPPAEAPATLPDIELNVSATARRVTVENRGRTSLELTTAANGAVGQNNMVDVRAPSLPQGRTELRDVRVEVRGEARIPDPYASVPSEEPAPPQ